VGGCFRRFQGVNIDEISPESKAALFRQRTSAA